MAKALTAAAVERYRPTNKRREIPDGGCPGLHLIVQPSGAKSWALRFRKPDGSPAKLTLGRVDLSGEEMPDEPVQGAPLTLAGAREVAAKVHRQRQMGRDVIADKAAAKRRRKLEQVQGAANTFGQLVRRFITEYAMKRTRRWRVTARLLGLRYSKDGSEFEVVPGGLAERWADRPLREIDQSDCWSIVDEARRIGVPGLDRRSDGPTEQLARGMFSALSAMLGWCARHRHVAVNVCTGLHRPEPSRPRDRTLSANEVVTFWRACDQVGEPFGAALKLLLLTACRVREIAWMRRDELSADLATLSLPASRVKNGRAHTVPLSTLARDILSTVKPIAGDYLFSTNGKAPIGLGSNVKRRLDALMKIPPWVLHDLRRTAATMMAEASIAPPHIIEAVLNHQHLSAVARTYNWAQYHDEKRIALQRWSDYIEQLTTGKTAKVVQLKR